MPYIGHNPTQAGSFVLLDDIASGFDGSDVTFTLQIGGVDITPTADNLIIALDGVMQHSPEAYSVSGSTLTFTAAPASGVDFYGMLMGQSASIGQGAIGADELSVTGNGSANQMLVSDGDGTMTWKGSGLSATSATGDLIYRNSGGELARLAVGSSGQVLTVASGVPAWETDVESYLPLSGGTMSGALNMGSQNITNGGSIAGTFTGNLTGDVTGNVTGNTSGTAATVTGAAQTSITSVGTLAGLTVSKSSGWAAEFYQTAADQHGVGIHVGNNTSNNSAFEVQNSAESATYFKVSQKGQVSLTQSNGNIYGLEVYHSSANTSQPANLMWGNSAGSTKAILRIQENATRSDLGTPVFEVYSTSSNTNLLTTYASGRTDFNNGIIVTGDATATKNFIIAADSTDGNNNERVKLGASADLQLWHNGNDSVVANFNTGKLYLWNYANGDTVLGSNDTIALTLSSANATFAGTISNTGLIYSQQSAHEDGIRFRGANAGGDNASIYYGKIGLGSGGYLQVYAEGNRSIDLKSGRQIRFFTSTDNSTYNNSFNLNSNGSVLASASISGDFSSKVYNSSSSGWGLQVQAGDGSGQYVFHCKDYDDANPLFWVKGNGLVYSKQGLGIRGSTPDDNFAIVSTGSMSFGSCEEVTVAGSRSGTDHTAENTAVQIELRNTHSNDNSAGAIVGLDKDGLELTKVVFKNDDHGDNKGSIDFHTSNGTGDMRTRRLRIDNGGDSYFYGEVYVDVGAPSSANLEIARFQAHSDRPIAVGWIDSGSKMSLYTPANHHLVLGAGPLGSRDIEIDDNGDIYFLGATSAPWDYTSGAGGLWQVGGVFSTAMSGGAGSSCFMANKTNAEGHMMDFAYDSSIKGYINLDGETVSLVGFSGQHESETSYKEKSIPKGTVMSSIGTTFKDDHVRTKISDSVGDTAVYGVVSSYASYDTGADKDVDYRMILNAVGISEVLVTGKASIGDLIESNGDGSAKVQDDEIIKSKTIGKVTKAKTTTSKGLALCVLYCG